MGKKLFFENFVYSFQLETNNFTKYYCRTTRNYLQKRRKNKIQKKCTAIARDYGDYIEISGCHNHKPNGHHVIIRDHILHYLRTEALSDSSVQDIYEKCVNFCLEQQYITEEEKREIEQELPCIYKYILDHLPKTEQAQEDERESEISHEINENVEDPAQRSEVENVAESETDSLAENDRVRSTPPQEIQEEILNRVSFLNRFRPSIQYFLFLFRSSLCPKFSFIIHKFSTLFALQLFVIKTKLVNSF